jgi:hypothetical protein
MIMALQEEGLKCLESFEEFLRGTEGLSARRVGTEAERQAPEGRAGFIRIDSVHQGDEDGVKGVLYTINAVDRVTQ